MGSVPGSDVEVGEFVDVFTSNDWVELEFAIPARRLVRNEAGALVYEDMSEMAQKTWGRDDGWPAVMTRLRSVARALGGEIETHSLVKWSDRSERNLCRWTEKPVDL